MTAQDFSRWLGAVEAMLSRETGNASGVAAVRRHMSSLRSMVNAAPSDRNRSDAKMNLSHTLRNAGMDVPA